MGDGSIILTQINKDRDIMDYLFLNVIKPRWKYSKDYTKEQMTYYKTKPLPFKISEEWFTATYYGYTLGMAPIEQYKIQDPWLKRELNRVDEAGCYCIYVSTVVYCLLLRNNTFKKGDFTLTQGFYKHTLREDFPEFIPMPKLHTGFHSWLSYQGSIIDFCLIPQEHDFFDFKDSTFLIGYVPKGMTICGVDEGHDVIMEYANEFAKDSGLDLDTWVELHYRRAKI